MITTPDPRHSMDEALSRVRSLPRSVPHTAGQTVVDPTIED